MEEPMMTEAQREELKTLRQKADVPDKSGELPTQEGAQHFIDDLKKQLAERSLAETSLRKVRRAPLVSAHEWMNPRSPLERQQSAHRATKPT